jgi:hypothetical protein
MTDLRLPTIGQRDWGDELRDSLMNLDERAVGAAAAVQKTDANLFYGVSSYPLRITVTADPTRRVRWIGPVSPSTDTGYAISGFDVWESTV